MLSSATLELTRRQTTPIQSAKLKSVLDGMAKVKFSKAGGANPEVELAFRRELYGFLGGEYDPETMMRQGAEDEELW
jgi:hypothetical protein